MKMKYIAYVIPISITISATFAMKYEFEVPDFPAETKYSIRIEYKEQVGIKQTSHGSEPEYKAYLETVQVAPKTTLSGDFFKSDLTKAFDQVQVHIFNESVKAALGYTICKLDVKDGKVVAKLAFNNNLPHIEQK